MAHLTKDTAAEAVSFVANDINKIFQGMQEIHFLWGAPIEVSRQKLLAGGGGAEGRQQNRKGAATGACARPRSIFTLC